MQSLLEINDFLEFEDFFKKLKEEIFDKHARGLPVCEELVTSLEKLSAAIDSLLKKVGKHQEKASHGCHSSIEHKNLQATCTKLLMLFENQFVGRDDDKPSKLYEFLD
jgi:hypothetical protein